MMKAIVTWDNGIEIVFTDMYRYVDYLGRVLWSGNYREGWDYFIEEVYDNNEEEESNDGI